MTEIEPMTDEQIEAVLTAWQEGGEKRLARFGAAFSEEDYIAGAMSVFFALESQDKMPASWAFFGLTSNSHFRKEEYQRESRDVAVRLVENRGEVLRRLKGVLALECDLDFGQTAEEVREDILRTIRKIEPGWSPRTEKESTP